MPIWYLQGASPSFTYITINSFNTKERPAVLDKVSVCVNATVCTVSVCMSTLLSTLVKLKTDEYFYN